MWRLVKRMLLAYDLLRVIANQLVVFFHVDLKQLFHDLKVFAKLRPLLQRVLYDVDDLPTDKAV